MDALLPTLLPVAITGTAALVGMRIRDGQIRRRQGRADRAKVYEDALAFLYAFPWESHLGT